MILQDDTEKIAAAGTLTQVMNAASEGIVLLDLAGNCTYVNSACLELLGYGDSSSLIGRNLHDLICCAAGREKTSDCQITAAIAKRACYQNNDEELLRADGKLIRTALHAAPLLSGTGEPFGAVVTISSIMEKRALEDQLRQAQKTEAIGTLAGGVAHDFNNVLTAIIGFGSLMEMKMTDDDPLRRNLQQILAAADRAAEISRSLLAFSRKQLTDMRILNLNRLVQGLEKMLRRLLREDIELSMIFCDGEPNILADAGQIEQVLLNLAANARDAMPKGGAVVMTTSRCLLDEEFTKANGLPAPGTYIVLSFADNGCGMHPEHLAQIFNPLFTTKPAGEASGLGLSVCYGVIRNHSGYIMCDTAPGKGAEFRIYLPEIAGPAVRAEKETALAHLRGKETLLLAEDDQSVRMLSKTALEQFGYKVIEAANGNEAVSLYLENRFAISLCIIDVIIPHKSGVTVYQEIKTAVPAAKIIFISGYSDEFLQKQEMPAGVKILPKPLAPIKLLEAVRKELDGDTLE